MCLPQGLDQPEIVLTELCQHIVGRKRIGLVIREAP
jgi:hypothetical protein